MFQKVKSYHDAIINKGLEYVSTEFDKRALRLLNLICLYGAIIIVPVILVNKIIEQYYIPIIIISVAFILLISVIYLNSKGKSQFACLLFSFSVNTIAYIAVSIEKEQIEMPFIALSIGFFTIFLIKNKFWRIVNFGYSFITFAILYYIQLTQKEFGFVGFILTLVVLLIFGISLRFVNVMRNRNEATILKQNSILKKQTALIKKKSEQLLMLEKEKHKQELLLKQKDMEMILANNQVQTQLNENIITRLKQAQQKGKDELNKNINQVILELYQQNEINSRMKLIEQNMDLVNTGFLDNLVKAHPSITRVDKEFCSYIKIGLSSKEIAIIRNTTVNSVNVTKTRLRKKLKLENGVTITEYFRTFK
ncbi:helix-turn-helix transcriptional regulator [Tenacibaculum agarivorans]|uniref:helix-turn-helix transcriptional regulator n=1 Tax=Tenacibaculum agarivorans TaxID=1908389 RepID=UPI00094B8698|nr:hypothetical protein [Tenacibaculum agarivorans]